jgi:hypothetical protein
MGLSRWDGGSGRNFGCPAARAIEPVQDVDVRVKKSVAPSKRSHRCFFGIVRSDPHGGQNSLLWLTLRTRPGGRPQQHGDFWRKVAKTVHSPLLTSLAPSCSPQAGKPSCIRGVRHLVSVEVGRSVRPPSREPDFRPVSRFRYDTRRLRWLQREHVRFASGLSW